MKSSNSPGDRDDLILVGRIVGVHGVQGNLKVQSYASSAAVFETGSGIWVAAPDGSLRSMAVTWVQPHGRGLLLNLETVSDRTQAATLIGSSLLQAKSALPTLEADTYYWFELVGLRVVDTTGNCLGCLDTVIPTPGHDIYVVKGDRDGQDRELLLPAIGDVIVKIDLASGTMTVDPPEGL